MNRNTYLALLAAVSIPFAAIAQEETTQEPAAQEEPLIEPDEQAAEEETMPADETEQAAETDAAGTEDEATETALAGEDEVEGPFVTVPLTGAWRVTDLEGKDVEDANGDNIGDITDVLVNEKGEVIAVLVGVGGFLGIGQKDVAVSMSALQFGPGKTEGLKTEEQRQQELQAEADAQAQLPATGTGSTGMGGSATTNTTASIEPPVREDPVVGRDNLPDRIVLNVTREELEAAPAYEDVAEGVDSGMTSDIPATEPVEPEPTE